MVEPQKLIDLCKNKTVWIQTHNFPDPDAIASAFGLQMLLKHFDIESQICHEGQIDKLSATKLLKLCKIKIHAYEKVVDQMTEEDMVILVDCQKNNGNTTDLIGDEQAAIDHHPTFAEISYLYDDLRITGACASLITEYYKILGIEPDRLTATALLYGMRMDTLQFSRGVTPFDIEMFGWIFNYADHKLLGNLETNNMEFSDLQAYGTAISNIRVFGKLGFTYIDFFCPDALVAALSDFILALAEIEVVVSYAKRDDGYKFSIRSERADVNAGELANKGLAGWGNGGGHHTMAGGFVKASVLGDDPEQVYHTVQDHFIEVSKELFPAMLSDED